LLVKDKNGEIATISILRQTISRRVYDSGPRNHWLRDRGRRLPLAISPETRRIVREDLRVSRMIVVTTENVAGHRTVQTLGQCFGLVVRSRGLGGNLIAGLRTIVGGEIHEYTQLL
jgi:hypothetical protein